MTNKVKYIDTENCTYYFFNDMIKIKNVDLNNIKKHEKPYKNVFIYYIGYVTIKDLKYINIYSINLFYLIFGKVNGCFEEINEKKYLALVPTNESKEKNI